MRYLGMCCIVKDETPFLEEWIVYHTLLGVEQFFIYDNESAEPVVKTLAPYMRDKFIIVHEVRGKAKQIICYNHCIDTYANECEWMGILDMDEFAVPKIGDDLRLTLQPFVSYGGVAFNWMVFGSNGHTARPQGLQIENYTRSMPDCTRMNRHVKLFVNPRLVNNVYNPHFAMLRENVIVNERLEAIGGAYSSPPSWNICQINHYYYRSKQDFYLKLRRGMADSGQAHHIPRRLVVPEGDVEDLSALRFAPKVLNALYRYKKVLPV